jgi:hypothetical protein
LCYSAFLVEGHDASGLDVGFLVRGRVLSAGVSQEGATQTFVDPGDLSNDVLFDRPPLVLRGVVDGPAGHNVDVAVVVNHLEAMDGLASAAGGLVAAKRRAQSEFLAGLLQNLQATAPVREWGTAPVVSLGNHNALDLNDGFVDVVGTASGSPAEVSTVVLASPDLVTPDFVNVTAAAYSAVTDGSTQALDHVLVSPASLPLVASVSVARVNADFPAAAANGADPVRLSPRDPAVAFFVFPADTTAPVLNGVPDNMTVEGNTLGGAVVTFVEPTAQDSVDGAVAVSCSPGSGATLPLGTTTVTCTAADSSSNVATASFNVTVNDTTPPQLTLPGPMKVAASGGAGATVSFSATATDVVAGARTPTCTPASGTLFPVGTTTVTCQVNDGNGNAASGSFEVTVSSSTAPPPVSGSMHGYGHVGARQGGTEFSFHVKETTNGLDKGWLVLQVRDGWRVSALVSAAVRTVVFSNSRDAAARFDRALGNRSERLPDTVVFTGVGWWRGRAGHSFEVRAEDHGEPGKGRDKFSVVVRDARGAVVHSVSGVLNSGNVQSVPVQ